MLIRSNKYLDQLKVKRRVKKSKIKFDRAFAPPFKLPTKDPRRLVFCDVRTLQEKWKTIPEHLLEQSLVILSCKREHIFHGYDPEISEERWNHFRAQADSLWYDFDKDFHEFLLFKESQKLLYWFRKERSYGKLSEWLEKIKDPLSGVEYQPLQLNEQVWTDYGRMKGWKLGSVEKAKEGKLNYNDRRPRFTASVSKVISALRSGSSDRNTMCEILFQSNPTLNFLEYPRVKKEWNIIPKSGLG
eukprot:g674.t1